MLKCSSILSVCFQRILYIHTFISWPVKSSIVKRKYILPVDGEFFALSAIEMIFTIGKPCTFVFVLIVPVAAQFDLWTKVLATLAWSVGGFGLFKYSLIIFASSRAEYELAVFNNNTNKQKIIGTKNLFPIL